MSLRSPLGKVLGSGSAKDGTAHFFAQRVSGVGLLLLGLWFVCSLLSLPGFSHAEALQFIAQPLNGVVLVLLVVTLAYHSFLGTQVVIEDYVHSHGLKLLSLVASRFAHVFLAVAAVYAVIKIGMSP